MYQIAAQADCKNREQEWEKLKERIQDAANVGKFEMSVEIKYNTSISKLKEEGFKIEQDPMYTISGSYPPQTSYYKVIWNI